MHSPDFSSRDWSARIDRQQLGRAAFADDDDHGDARSGCGRAGSRLEKGTLQVQPCWDKYLVVIEGANHLSFGGGLRARGDGVTEVVKRCTTSYWDAYLKDSKVAKEHLKSGRLEQELAGKCTLEQK